MSTQKKYVGNGKAIEGKFGTFFNLSLKLDDLNKIEPNEKGYIKISMSQLKEPDKFGNTHTVYENDYKPVQKEEITETDDMPF